MKEEIRKKLSWLIIPSEMAARLEGGSHGFQAISEYLGKHDPEFFTRMTLTTIEEPEPATSQDDPAAKNISGVLSLQAKVCETIIELRRNGVFPMVISGDHSSAAGIAAGISMAHAGEKIGIVYIDAHADLHSPFTSPSGNMHGMSLAVVCGLDHMHLATRQPSARTKALWDSLKNLSGRSPAVEPECIAFCAVRDTEKEEEEVIREHSMLNVSVGELRKEGVENTVKQLLSRLSGCEHIYVSFDIDSLDPDIAPGTGTPVSQGLSLDEAKELCALLIRDKRVCCWELTELNPHRDRDGSTVAAASMLITEVTEELLEHY